MAILSRYYDIDQSQHYIQPSNQHAAQSTVVVSLQLVFPERAGLDFSARARVEWGPRHALLRSSASLL